MIRVYGLEENSTRPTCIEFSNYNATCYIELTEGRTWSPEALMCMKMDITKQLGGVSPISFESVKRRVLMGAHVVKIDDKYEPKFFDFVEIKFNSWFTAKNCESVVSKVGVNLGHGRIRLKVHLNWIPLWFQFALEKKLPICGEWLELLDYEPNHNKSSICDREFKVYDLKTATNQKPPPPIPTLAYDIEVYTSTIGRFPTADNKDDVIFQVSMIMGNEMVLITRGQVNISSLKDRFKSKIITVYEVKSEHAILDKFVDVLHQMQPLVIIGYNNLQFDGPYMIEKAKTHAMCWNKFSRFTMNRNIPADVKELAWSSSASPDQHFTYMNGEGYSHMDLCAIIKNIYKNLSQYTLNHVSQHFLKSKKDDVDVYKMCKTFENMVVNNDLSDKSIDDMTMIGAYCYKTHNWCWICAIVYKQLTTLLLWH